MHTKQSSLLFYPFDQLSHPLSSECRPQYSLLFVAFGITTFGHPPCASHYYKSIVDTISAFVSKGYITRYHKLSSLNTTEMYPLTVMEDRNPKSRCWQGHAFSESSREGFFLAPSSFWWPQVFLGWRQRDTGLCPVFPQLASLSIFVFTWCPLCVCASGSTCPSFHKGTTGIGLRRTPMTILT